MGKALLPPNATAQELAIDGAIARIGDVEVPIANLWNPDLCPEVMLPWLAWALSVEPWDHDWPVWRQREVIKASIPNHRIKGTVGAIRQILSAAGFGAATILERLHRFNCDGQVLCAGTHYCGDPAKWPHYRIQLEKPITNPQALLVRAMLDGSDRAISRLDALDFTAAFFACNGEINCDGTYNLGVA